MAQALTNTPQDTPVGKVLIAYGDVKAINDAGMERNLAPNSPLFENERVVTGPDGSISVLFNDEETQLVLGKLSDVRIDAEVYSKLDNAEIENAIADVNQIQQALVEGNFDPTQLPPTAAGAPAAGATDSDGGGRETVEFTPDGMEITPDSGAETIGLARDFLDPPTINILEEDTATTPTLDTAPTFTTPVVTTPAPEPLSPEPPTPVPPTPEPPTPVPPTPEPPTPPPPPEPLTMADPDEVLTVSEIAPLMGTEPQQVSGNFLDNVQDAITPVISSITVQDENGTAQVISLTPGETKTVDIYQDDLKTGTLTVNSDGSYTYKLDSQANHNTPEQHGENDDFSLKVGYQVTDTATGQVDESNLTIIIEDGEPVVSVDQDAILANEGGNSATGQITADYGADGQATLVPAMQLLDAKGESLISEDPVNNPIFVTDTNGTPLTSGGEKLIYKDNGSGGVDAVIYNGTEEGGATVFTVTLTPPAAGESDASYTVTLDETNILDKYFETTTTEETISLKDLTVDNEGKAEGTSPDGQVHITVSGTDLANNAATVTSNDQGVGLDGKQPFDHADMIDNGESITISFQDDNGNDTAMSDVTLDITGLTNDIDYGIMESATWTAYDKDGNIAVDSNGNTLENIRVTGDNTEGSTTLAIDADSVAKVTLSGVDKASFNIDSITGQHTTIDDDTQSVEYTVKITDSDEVGGSSTGDTDTSEVFSVTFDSDGDITGTDAAETISGSSDDDTITGGGGNDTIYAHSGDDVINGGDGDDKISGGSGNDTLSGENGNDIIAGGEGIDTISTGEGNDTVAESEVNSGEVTDMDSTDVSVADNDSDISSLVDDSTITG